MARRRLRAAVFLVTFVGAASLAALLPGPNWVGMTAWGLGLFTDVLAKRIDPEREVADE